LKYAHLTQQGWQVTSVVTGGARGRFPSLQLDHWDRPHIAWLDVVPGDSSRCHVRYGVLNAEVWEIEEIDTLVDVNLSFGGARKSVSLVLDDNWRPHLAYADERRISYAVKPFADWQYTNVLLREDRLLKGMAVLRLHPVTHAPTIAFWQSLSGQPGLIRMARPGTPPATSTFGAY
jgi:hypothetical protein